MTYRAQGGPDTAPNADFRKIVKDYVQANNGNRRVLAARFDASLSTVDRWWIGTASPHPLLQEQVIAWIREQR